jgi:hypothetical protein
METHRWGTYSPRLRQNTTVTFLSSQPLDGSDQDYYTPFVEAGTTFAVVGTLLTQSTGSLNVVTSKNRATPQLLQATLTTATAAAGNIITNTTHASRAWADVGGATVTFTQPLTEAPTPPVANIGFTIPTEVNTWAHADNITVSAPTQVNLRTFAPVTADGKAASPYQSSSWLQDIYVADPAGADAQPGLTTIQLGTTVQVNVWDCSFDVEVNIANAPLAFSFPGALSQNNTFSNVWFNGGLVVGGATSVWGGSIGKAEDGYTVINGNSQPVNSGSGVLPVIDGDTNVYGAFVVQNFAQMGLVYLATSSLLDIMSNGVVQFATGYFTGGPILWGPGAPHVFGTGHISYPGGAATSVFLQTGAFNLNGGTTACSHTNASPDVINCGITINATNLNAAAGSTGFGDDAFLPGGGSISKY